MCQPKLVWMYHRFIVESRSGTFASLRIDSGVEPRPPCRPAVPSAGDRWQMPRVLGTRCLQAINQTISSRFAVFKGKLHGISEHRFPTQRSAKIQSGTHQSRCSSGYSSRVHDPGIAAQLKIVAHRRKLSDSTPSGVD